MTGFARKAADYSMGTLTWEVRSVNHRYLDVQFRLPEELRPSEAELRQQIGAALHRGKIDAQLNFRRASGETKPLQINAEAVTRLQSAVTELSSSFSEMRPLNPLDVLRWPGIVEEPEVDQGPLLESAQALLGETLTMLEEMRAAEGGRIGDMLISRCEEIERIAASVAVRMDAVQEGVRNKLLERLKRLDIEADSGRLETELALIAQKMDVAEEIDRLGSHITEIRDIVAQDGPVGRRLDFLMQELNREANTLGSKSADSETTKAAMDLKVLIEQMREQIQNVE
jgi:uncharacterized protein (TIGR00255 family)